MCFKKGLLKLIGGPPLFPISIPFLGGGLIIKELVEVPSVVLDSDLDKIFISEALSPFSFS